MDPGRWDEIQTAFDDLVDRDATERVDRLAEIGTADPDLRAALESLLAADAEADDRLAAIEATLSPPRRGEHLERVRAALSDRYRVERELGSGGMATVYLAEDLKHRRDVAVKVLRFAGPVGPERFLDEIEMTARLDHPHLLPLLDSGEAGGFLYYVMPYVEGESLRERLDREERLSIDDAVQIALEVADALEFAHQRDVIHRDIKPENILLSAGHARVADFGIARAISASGGDRLTDAGLGTGTPTYMSPEQAAGGAEVGPRSDVYSLGCVLYEMLAGEPPFKGSTAEEVSRKHTTAAPPDIEAVRSDLPPQLVAALSRALEKAPPDRFESAREFAETLRSGVSTSRTLGRRTSRRQRVLLGTAAVIVLTVALAIGQWGPPGRALPGPAESAYPRASIAVLPFENLTAEPSRAFFASGLHDELWTQLARVSALKVISRTSVRSYAETTKPLAVIAEELEVGSIVEGNVQVEGDRLRVYVRLIDTATEEPLWAERYDRTIDDVFATQSEIAGHIVTAVGASLTEEEAGAFAAAPTENPEAFRLYLRGWEYMARLGSDRADLESAEQLFGQAVALDSTFARAHAALSSVHGDMWWFGHAPSPKRLALAREEAEIALRLAPEAPWAHMAMSYAHYREADWQPALDEMEIALQSIPNDWVVWHRFAAIHRRLGHWDEALAAAERASELAPDNAEILWDMRANTLRYLHRYAEAMTALDRALALAPEFAAAQLMKAELYLEWHGELDSLRALMDRAPESFGLGGSKIWWQIRLALQDRKPDVMLDLLSTPSLPVEGHGVEQLGPDALGLLFEGWAHQLRGDETAVHRAFADALVQLDSVSPERHPNYWKVHASRGLALAGLGRRSEAKREAEFLRVFETGTDVYPYGQRRVQRAMILAQAGWVEEALAAIEPQLSGPGWISTHVLRIDPRWDPIRDDSRFEALLARYEN